MCRGDTNIEKSTSKQYSESNYSDIMALIVLIDKNLTEKISISQTVYFLWNYLGHNLSTNWQFNVSSVDFIVSKFAVSGSDIKLTVVVEV